MSWVLPVGIDSADGVTVLPLQPSWSPVPAHVVGTPLPTGEAYVWTSTGVNKPFTEEMDGSPRIERAEQCTCEHRLKMDKQSAINYWVQMPRGTIVTDSAGNIWRVLSCEYTRSSDLETELHYVMESLSFDSPPDDFGIHEVSMDLNIIKHPRYWWALCPYESDSEIQVGDNWFGVTEVKEAIIRMVQNYIESPFYPSANQINSLIQCNIINVLSNGNFQIQTPNPNFKAPKSGSSDIPAPVTWDGFNAHIPSTNCLYFLVTIPSTAFNLSDPNDPIATALAAAKELISKLWRQEDTPYIAGFELTWTQYFFHPVYLNPGGYREDPRDWVPGYFMDVAATAAVTLIPRGYQGSLGQDPTPGATGITPLNNMDQVPALQYGAGTGKSSILDCLVLYNPQCFSSDGTVNGVLNFSSLRTADDMDYERTWFKVPHKWKIATVGKWDSDLYKLLGQPGPQNALGFNQNPFNMAQL